MKRTSRTTIISKKFTYCLEHNLSLTYSHKDGSSLPRRNSWPTKTKVPMPFHLFAIAAGSETTVYIKCHSAMGSQNENRVTYACWPSTNSAYFRQASIGEGWGRKGGRWREIKNLSASFIFSKKQRTLSKIRRELKKGCGVPGCVYARSIRIRW